MTGLHDQLGVQWGREMDLSKTVVLNQVVFNNSRLLCWQVRWETLPNRTFGNIWGHLSQLGWWCFWHIMETRDTAYTVQDSPSYHQ